MVEYFDNLRKLKFKQFYQKSYYLVVCMSVYALNNRSSGTQEEEAQHNKSRGTAVEHKKNLKVVGAFAFECKHLVNYLANWNQIY